MIYQHNMISTYFVKIYFVKSQMLHDTERMEKDDFMGLFCVELSRLNDLTDEYVGVEFMNVYQIDGSC